MTISMVSDDNYVYKLVDWYVDSQPNTIHVQLNGIVSCIAISCSKCLFSCDTGYCTAVHNPFRIFPNLHLSYPELLI